MGPVDDECSGMNDESEAGGIHVGDMDDLVLTVAPEADIMPWNRLPVCDDPGLKPASISKIKIGHARTIFEESSELGFMGSA